MNTWSEIASNESHNMMWSKYQCLLQELSINPKSNLNANLKPTTRSSEFHNYPEIKLTPNDQNHGISLVETILDRRTNRHMQRKEVSLQLLSNLLTLGYKRQDNKHRTAPSAGALYPIDIYVHCHDLQGPDEELHGDNLFFYDVEAGSLRLLNMPNHGTTLLEKAFVQKDVVQNSAIQMFFVVNLKDMISKYGEKGYQLSLIETGHIAQNFNLSATALKLNCVNISGINHQALNDLLLLDGNLQFVAYSMLLG